jgi:uncharacterized damage-inducible protein DinB
MPADQRVIDALESIDEAYYRRDVSALSAALKTFAHLVVAQYEVARAGALESPEHS